MKTVANSSLWMLGVVLIVASIDIGWFWGDYAAYIDYERAHDEWLYNDYGTSEEVPEPLKCPDGLMVFPLMTFGVFASIAVYNRKSREA